MHRRTCPPFRSQAGGKLCQPGDRSWRAMPRRAAFSDVVGRLVRTTHSDIAIVVDHRRLRAGQYGRDVLVCGPCIPDQRRGLIVAIPVTAKGHERPCVEPERAAVLMGGQQLLERAVIALSEQAPGEDIPYPLIVVRVQLQQVAIVAKGAVDALLLLFFRRPRQSGRVAWLRRAYS